MRAVEGKRVLIAGATSEIGAETARLLAREGADLLLVARRRELLEALATECARYYGVNSTALPLDLTAEGSAERLREEVVQRFGRLDALVSYVGYPFDPDLWYRSLRDLREEELRRVFDVDFFANFRLVRSLLEILRGGVVVLTTSTPAISWYRYGSAYSMAKLAVVGLVRSIAAEYRNLGIRAYALALGNIRTSATFDKMTDEERRALAEESPMGRWGEPVEVARVVLALISDLFSFVNGQVIVVDGGTLMIG
jgi:NAD(P)-dependent dehydrogenase (short-subunit alcohol dehydrogenase family)